LRSWLSCSRFAFARSNSSCENTPRWRPVAPFRRAIHPCTYIGNSSLRAKKKRKKHPALEAGAGPTEWRQGWRKMCVWCCGCGH
jgi:hypothetical protein